MSKVNNMQEEKEEEITENNSSSENSSNVDDKGESQNQQEGSLGQDENVQDKLEYVKENQMLHGKNEDIQADQDDEEEGDIDEDFQVEGADNPSSGNDQQVDDELNIESNQLLSDSALKKKRKAGRPQKKDFLSAEKQKNMKELQIEIELASSFSSENYLLLYCALLIYGQGPKGNKYIVKAYSQGEKDLDVGSKVKSMGATVSVECKRMWLLYWKISRILNRDTNSAFKELWTAFQGIVMNENTTEKFDSSILSSISKLRQLFVQNKQFVEMKQNQRYSSITEYCFDPQLDQESDNEGSSNEAEEEDEDDQEKEQEEINEEELEQKKKEQKKQNDKNNEEDSESNGSKYNPDASKKQKKLPGGQASKGRKGKKSSVKKEEANAEQSKDKNCVKGKNVSFNSKKDRENNRHFDYQSFEKHLLHLHKFQKSDFLAILFSCAVSEYFNILSPYFDSFCNIL